MSESGSGLGEASEAPRVLYTDAAEAELEAAYLWLMQRSYQTAERWLSGLESELRHQADLLVALPGRRNLAQPDEQLPGRTIYLLRYRLRRQGSAWRILYELADVDEDGRPHSIRVVRIRHAAMRPLPEDAADEIE